MSVEKILERMRNNPKNIRFDELDAVCRKFFGEPRQNGSSHRIYKTPWQGDPRINIQNDGGMAKRYQVITVLAAVDKLLAMKGAE